MGTENKVDLPDIIRDRKLLPVEEKQSIMNHIFSNCVIFMVMLLITLTINTLFEKLSVRGFERFIDIIQIICGVASVAILEFAYRKDSGKFALHGIEVLVFSVCVLFVPYSYNSKSNFELLKNMTGLFFIYYSVKSIGTLLHIRHKYLKENMSDIKELVKEEKQGYIDEESTKTLKEQNEKKKHENERTQKEKKKSESEVKQKEKKKLESEGKQKEKKKPENETKTKPKTKKKAEEKSND